MQSTDFDSNVVPDMPDTDEETNPAIAEGETGVKVDSADKSTAKVEPKPESKVQGKAATDKKTKFYVQVGVFSDAGNVKELQSKLSDLGYKSQTEMIDTDKGKKIRLRTQEFVDRNEAAIALENIKDAGLTGMVVSQ